MFIKLSNNYNHLFKLKKLDNQIFDSLFSLNLEELYLKDYLI